MKYTVVGYWKDNCQPWIAWTTAGSPKVAALAAAAEAEESDELIVVDVFEGHHTGKLKNETILPPEELK